MLKFNSRKQNIFFFSDPHYWHKNITYGESVWENKETGCRRFNTTQEMSRHIVEQINKYVGQEDVLFCLGDWSFGGINNIWNFRKQIICKDIFSIAGNHDHHIIKDAELPNCPVDEYPGVVNKDVRISGNMYAQELFNYLGHYEEIFIDGRMLCLSHYPMEEWNDRHHKAWMLHGHSHGNARIIPKRLDIGMDNAFKLFGEYKPFNWKDVSRILNK